MQPMIRDLRPPESGGLRSEEMDDFLRGLGLADPRLRSALIQESVLASVNEGRAPTVRDVRWHVATRAAEVLDRAPPRSDHDAAEAILAFVLSGAARRHPGTLLHAHGSDTCRARRLAPYGPLATPREHPAAMPVQSLEVVPLWARLLEAWRTAVRDATATVNRAVSACL